MARAIAFLFLLAGFQDEFPNKARLTKVRPSKPLLSNFAAVNSPDAWEATVNRASLWFVDLDKDGQFDGWLPAGSRYVLPLDPRIVLGTNEIHIRVAMDVAWRAEAIKGSKEQLDALMRLNELRIRNGLPPATLDLKLSDACSKHSKYMGLNNELTHDEEPGRPGYTEEGAAAGKSSCISTQGVVDGVRAFHDSFYHRLPMMHPNTRGFGIAGNRAWGVIDGYRNFEDREWKFPIVVPAPDSEGHETGFYPAEIPCPHPGIANPGNAITLAFETAAITKVRAHLHEGGPTGREVTCLVSSPEFPASKERGNNGKAICLIPKSRLRSKTTYWVSVTWVEDGTPDELKWTFRTGN